MVSIIDDEWLRFIYGAIGGIGISLLAFRFKALSLSGAIAAAVMGTSFVFFGEPVWFILLLTFFTTSTFWSKYKKHSKRKQNAEALYEKTGSRDAMQVFANGGIGMLLCILHYYWQSEWLLYSFIAVMAAANADTWATEIGGLSKAKPRSILTGKAVPSGTSGGITIVGSFAAVLGALFIGLIAYLVLKQPLFIVVATVSGTLGAFADSLLGAAWQNMNRCVKCGKETETSIHCQEITVYFRGLRWMNNDAVNMLSSAAAAIAAIMLMWLI